MMEPFKVNSTSDVHKVAGAIAGAIREHGEVQIRTIGAGPVNQAVKAIAIAKDFLKEDGLVLVCQPQFKNVVRERRRPRSS